MEGFEYLTQEIKVAHSSPVIAQQLVYRIFLKTLNAVISHVSH